MAGRPTITDLAREAQVSVATVDRVLNGRARVREETARRVYEAAQRIGYHAAALIGQRMMADLPEIRFGIVFAKERQPFYQHFREEMEGAIARATGIRGRMFVEFSPSQSPSDFAELLEKVSHRADVVAATAVNHIQVTDTVARIQERGVPCMSLLNDFAQGVRKSYIGINNMKAGRVAAHMLSKSIREPGKIAVFVGGFRWHGHELRETGFRSYFREYGPGYRILDTLVNLETRQLTYEATLELLQRHPDLRGLYCAGGGMEGAIAALREARAPGDVALVVHEFTAESRAALADRYAEMVVATPLQQLCEACVDLATKTVQGGAPLTPGQLFLRPDLYLPESV
ncbi:LacI family DNA-binding transcriptional regulator [Sagittula salina]|uniref:LacI family DNA-binding transcriptional regulator n=1 Tax=Sagittula salina TaxID=2820268 RepID=A0A940S398_9RHOB|nr:LacI family DNA-binding transcriptional regulator [Sagittula salina]MBP0482525.1 LacI family DNA-binding transcriptional regulator [Sagittula salina]